MPRLSDDNAEKVNNSEGGGSFGPVPAGKYILRLTEVENTKSAKEKPMWVWKFEVESPAEYKGHSIWERTVVQDNVMWKFAQIFAGFGVDSRTHTDDLIGHTVEVMIDQRVIGSGKSEGKIGNDIKEYFVPPKKTESESKLPF